MSVGRTGSHSVMWWLMHQFADIKFYHPPKKLDDSPKHYYKIASNNRCMLHHNHIPPSASSKEFLDKFKDYNRMLFIRSYETSSPVEFVDMDMQNPIIHLRDAYNTSASFYKKFGDIPQRIIQLQTWKDLAREWLGITNHIPDKILHNYYQWRTDDNYRRKFVERLGLTFTDIGVNEVSYHGDGSSFVGTKYNGVAADMDLDNRWRKFVDDELYKKTVLEDKELRELSLEIFPHVNPFT